MIDKKGVYKVVNGEGSGSNLQTEIFCVITQLKLITPTGICLEQFYCP